jgi:mortality factor 4-like protein 1
LKREMEAIQNQNKPTPKPSKEMKPGRKGSETRGSEERGMGGQSKKRGRDLDTERVSPWTSFPSVMESMRKSVDDSVEMLPWLAKKNKPSKSVMNDSSMQEDQYNAKPAIRIPISDPLKSILVDDWENVTKNLQLVHVPAQYSANRILDDYLEYEKERRQHIEGGYDGWTGGGVDLLEEIVAGLREYFNKALGRLLLYRYERGQYEDVLKRINDPSDDLSNKQIGDVYGAEHLLRLFGRLSQRDAAFLTRIVSLPELIAQTNMDRQSVARVREELSTFNTWMTKAEQIKKYLSTPYENATTEYMERVSS